VLVDKGIIEALGSWLIKNDSKTLIVLLEGLNNILYVGKTELGTDEFSSRVEGCGALDSIEKLQEYPNQHVYELSLNILESYFQLEEVDLGATEDAGMKLNFA